jgi:hypothetical protein
MNLAKLIILLAPAIARADAHPDFDDHLHWQLEPTVRMAIVRLNGSGIDSIGGALAVGARWSRLMIALEASEMFVEAPAGLTATEPHGGDVASAPGSGGTLDRYAALARFYILHKVGNSDPLLVDAWVAAGLGRERFAWDTGGTLDRNDVELAVGSSFGAHGDAWWGGMTIALRIIYARRKDGLQSIACGGPCDVATRPSSLDRTIALDLTFPFGK